MSDTASIAMAQRTFWNSEATRRWVTEQARIDRLMAGVTEAALAAAAPKRGERVLDVGCGTGTTVLRLAEGVGPSGRVLGVDISEQQLALARQRVAAAGVNQAQLVLDDAATHHFAPETFDLGFSRFGVMFFADPVAAFRNIRGAMKRSGRLLLAVFRSGQKTRGQPQASLQSVTLCRRLRHWGRRSRASSVGATRRGLSVFSVAPDFETWC